MNGILIHGFFNQRIIRRIDYGDDVVDDDCVRPVMSIPTQELLVVGVMKRDAAMPIGAKALVIGFDIVGCNAGTGAVVGAAGG